MRLYLRRVFVSLLLVVLVLAIPLNAQIASGNCTFRCNRSYSGDSAECVTARYLGHGDCVVAANCQAVLLDADGPFGPASPTLHWFCTYDCTYQTCIWV